MKVLSHDLLGVESRGAWKRLWSGLSLPLKQLGGCREVPQPGQPALVSWKQSLR